MPTHLKPQLNCRAKVLKNVYEDIRRNNIVVVNDIQYDFYAKGSHRYWVFYNGNNYFFNQKELELA